MSDPKPTLAEAIRHALKTRTFPLHPITGTGGMGLTEHDIANLAHDWFANYVQRDDVVEAVASGVAAEFFRMEGGEDLLAGGVSVGPDVFGGDHAVARAALAALVETMRGESDG